MANFLAAHANELWSALIGAMIGATVSIPITVRITRNSTGSGDNRVNQSHAKARGDNVGRDKIKN